MFTLPRQTILALPLALFAVAATAAAQTVIDSVPYTINASGKYVLATNFNNTKGYASAIVINAPNVVLDLNGFYISGPGLTASSAPVIGVNNVANVTIRNGLLANEGFGIVFYGGNNARNYKVEDMTISRCYVTGVYFGSAAPGSLVRNNAFSNIGGYTGNPDSSTDAILAQGGTRLENNTIATVTATGTGTGYGILASGTDFALGNTISNCKVGISGGKYLNNLTANCTTPFNGGTNATGNN